MKKLFKYFFFIFITFSLFSYEVIEDTSNLKILTESLKTQKTIKLKLKNNLKVYIISDPEIKESAASIAVNVGSWSDPEEYPGMAHFTEHMLFQGTEKYPDREDFWRFIEDRKGKTNAHTSSLQTVYMFSINNKSFKSALDRFSKFFTCPLFDESAVKSELYAVDQEYFLYKENDIVRTYYIWKELGNKNHPNHIFSFGNSETLSKIPRKDLLNWHKKHYTAENMSLCIYTNIPINEMVKEVLENFQTIPKGQKLDLNFKELSSPIQKGAITYIKPIKNLQILSLLWEVPKKFASDDTKSLELIEYALTAGQKNSLLEILKKENLVESLNIEVENMGKKHLLFEMFLFLTDKGLQKTDLVIQRCFEAINNLKKEKIPKYLFDEFYKMRKINYEYQSRVNPFSLISRLSSNMLDENLSTYPRMTLFPTKYSEKTISSLLENLSPSLCQFSIIAPPSKTKISPTKKEKWFEGEYTLIKIPDEKLTFLENVENSEIALPDKNLLIPTNLSLIKREENHKNPIKISENIFGKAFYIQDQFKTPKVNFIFHVKTPKLDVSPKSYILCNLFLKNFKEQITPLILQADFAGLYPQITFDKNEIIFDLSGYSEKAPLFLNFLLEELKNLKTHENKFNTFISSFKKTLENQALTYPRMQASSYLTSIIQNTPTPNDLLKSINNITYKDFLEFNASLFEKTYIEAIFSGNITEKQSLDIFNDVQNFFSKIPFENHTENKITSLPKGPFQITKETSVSGNGIILAIDENPFSFKRFAAQAILAQGLKEPFFTQMRSKQKTAYFVRSYGIEIKKHLFQTFSLQSSFLDPEELLYRFEIFIGDFLQNIEKNIDENRFESIKNNLILSLKMPPKNIQEFTGKFDSLAFEYKDFDFINKKIKALESITYSDFTKLSEEFLSRKNKKRLAILVKGKVDENQNFTYINSNTIKAQ
jgi:insulysin